jgi:hypothetical protein
VGVADVLHGIAGGIEGEDDRAALRSEVADEVEPLDAGLVALRDIGMLTLKCDADLAEEFSGVLPPSA